MAMVRNSKLFYKCCGSAQRSAQTPVRILAMVSGARHPHRSASAPHIPSNSTNTFLNIARFCFHSCSLYPTYASGGTLPPLAQHLVHVSSDPPDLGVHGTRPGRPFARSERFDGVDLPDGLWSQSGHAAVAEERVRFSHPRSNEDWDLISAKRIPRPG